MRYRGTRRPLLAARPGSSAPRAAKPSGVLQGYEWSPPGVGVHPASLEGSAQAAAPGRYRHVEHRRVLALPGSVAVTCHLHRSTPFPAGSAARGCWTGEGTRCCRLLLCPELVCALIGVTPAPALPRGQGTEPFVSARSRARLSVCWDRAVRCSRGRLCASLCLCVQFAAAQLRAGSVLSVFSPQQSFQGMQPAQDALECTKRSSNSPGQPSPHGLSHWDISGRWHLAARCPEGSWTEPPRCSNGTRAPQHTSTSLLTSEFSFPVCRR